MSLADVPGPLVGVAPLAAALRAGETPTLGDVRWSLSGPPGRGEYDAGHLPGAVFVDLDRALAGPPGVGGRHPLPPPDVFVDAMRDAGVSDTGTVVVYDAGPGLAAARAWWLLCHYGHTRVLVLDGGLAAWTRAGHPVTSAVPRPPRGDFSGSPGHMPVVDAGEAAALARRGVLLDARAPERFRGDHEPVDPVAGHIPGAVNRPTTANLAEDGTMADPRVLAAELAALGIGPGSEVATYCGSGVTAAHQVLALQVAGVEAALYPGSWSEWVTDPTRPVATGE